MHQVYYVLSLQDLPKIPHNRKSQLDLTSVLAFQLHDKIHVAANGFVVDMADICHDIWISTVLDLLDAFLG